MSERPDPALFNPDLLSPADQEILEVMEKAIGSIDFPLELQKCSECGSKCGGWIPEQSSSNDGDNLGKTPVVFCLPYPCAYNWNQRNKVTGRNVVVESKRVAREVDKISSSTPTPLLGGRSKALNLEHRSISPGPAGLHVAKTKSANINDPSLNIEGLMTNKVIQANEFFKDKSYELWNRFGTTVTPVEPVTNKSKISTPSAQGKTLLQRAASVQQELEAKRNGRGTLSERLTLLLNQNSKVSIGDSGDLPSSSESVESEMEVGGQDQGREKTGNKRQNVSKKFIRNLSSSPEPNSTIASKRPRRLTVQSKGPEKDGSSEPTAGLSCAKLKTPKLAEPQSNPSKRRVMAKVEGVEGIPEVYRPSEWLTGTVPKRIPYFPQLRDELVYLRQGHELYVQQVAKLNIYPLDGQMTTSLPYVQDPQLPPVVPVRVVQIEFQLNPPRVVKLKLARIEWGTGRQTGSFLYVRYHYLPSVPEFLVLKQIYDKSLRHSWRAGDRFRCMIEKTWWIGTVVMNKPFDPKLPESTFRSYFIRWGGDDQTTNQLSPWDMEMIPANLVVPEDAVQNGIPATDGEVRNIGYEATPKDWKRYKNHESECLRISSLVESVMNLAIAEAFLTPMDLSSCPDYAYEIAYPMDLSTIKGRLDNLFYRRYRAILTDVERIAMNAEKLNVPDSQIVWHARVITKLLQEIVNNQEFGSVNEAYYLLMAEETMKTVLVGKDLQAGRSHTDSSLALASSSSAHISTAGSARINTDDSNCRWKEMCKNVLDTMWNSFRGPHNTINANSKRPTTLYLEMLKPLLEVARDRLNEDVYKCPQDFYKDMNFLLDLNEDRSTQKDVAKFVRRVFEKKFARIVHIQSWDPVNFRNVIF